MFLLVSGRHVGAHTDGHQHGVSIQISINLGKKFLRISRIRKIAVTRILWQWHLSLRFFFCDICHSVTDVSVGFRPPCWCPYEWAPAWRLHTNLYRFGEKISSHISHKKNCCDQNFDENLCIFTFFHFPDSGLYLLTGLDFYFDLFWIAWHWKPAICGPKNIWYSLSTAAARDPKKKVFHNYLHKLM